MKFYIVAIFVIFVSACQDVKRPEKPENLIPKEKMVDVISEAYLANAARSVDNREIVRNGIKLDSLVYQKYDIDSLQFAQSNAYYAADMNTYLEIFREVQARFEGMVKNLDSLQKIQRIKDSINNVSPKVEPTEPIKDSLI
ncbi:DUF4296 domain-containing protein [Aequorivita echinoideorum]|uniref:DUF4296 domain-containing protein n=1 Tax=Aequorivita echinoideorum TaxID=1549647 RepID=A0ABS5S113_9FLAO|nr:DUF4296 domain-containing protein [Aequorivita echinoideorum]MBT0606860.1 DUF4296 domain-containing protein [Aequorivita echinoideorum]